MNSKILNFSLIMSLFVTVFSIQSADTTFSKRFSNACAMIEGKIKSQRDLDKQFLMAVYQNNIDDADYWLKAGANVNAIQNYNSNEFPSFKDALHLQNRNLFALNLAKDSNMIKFLISKGADVNKNIPQQLLPREIPTLNTVIENSIKLNKPGMIINMIMAGAKIDKETINYLHDKLKSMNEDMSATEHSERIELESKKNNLETVIKFVKEQLEIQRKQYAKEIYETAIFPKVLAEEIAGYAV